MDRYFDAWWLIMMVAVIVAFCFGVWMGEAWEKKQQKVSREVTTVTWGTAASKNPHYIYSRCLWHFSSEQTVELGIREDGLVVWREVEK